jgi:hypothetical protein
MMKGKKNNWWNVLKYVKEYSSQKNNIYKAAGIISAGVAGFLIFKYFPWNKITDKFEIHFDEVFGEGEFINQPGSAEGSF